MFNFVSSRSFSKIGQSRRVTQETRNTTSKASTASKSSSSSAAAWKGSSGYSRSAFGSSLFAKNFATSRSSHISTQELKSKTGKITGLNQQVQDSLNAARLGAKSSASADRKNLTLGRHTIGSTTSWKSPRGDVMTHGTSHSLGANRQSSAENKGQGLIDQMTKRWGRSGNSVRPKNYNPNENFGVDKDRLRQGASGANRTEASDNKAGVAEKIAKTAATANSIGRVAAFAAELGGVAGAASVGAAFGIFAPIWTSVGAALEIGRNSEAARAGIKNTVGLGMPNATWSVDDIRKTPLPDAFEEKGGIPRFNEDSLRRDFTRDDAEQKESGPFYTNSAIWMNRKALTNPEGNVNGTGAFRDQTGSFLPDNEAARKALETAVANRVGKGGGAGRGED